MVGIPLFCDGIIRVNSAMSPKRVPVADLPGSLPQEPVPPETNPKAVAASLSIDLSSLKLSDFVEGAFWRDTYALTGTLRTFYSDKNISAALEDVYKTRKPSNFRLHAEAGRIHGSRTWIDIPFEFDTASAPRTICSGTLSIVCRGRNWKIWMLQTILEQLVGECDVDRLDPVSGDLKDTSGIIQDCEFDVVVVGAGQAGLSIAGRLKALGVSYVVLDKVDHVGDNWKLRYDSVRLHTSRQYSHLPFNRTFPTGEYQEWLTKDDLARGYQDWVHTYGINISLSTNLVSGTWNQKKKAWNLNVLRHGEKYAIRTSKIVLATGAGGQTPLMPDYPNRENHQGSVLHSSEYRNPSDFRGRHGVVIGNANTAHDIAEDMVDAGLASVTLVQRSRTYVMPREYYKRVQDLLYNDNIPTELADRRTYSSPMAVTRLLSHQTLHASARAEPERFDALERAGFKLIRYGDIMHYLYDRGGGYYMDVGASQKISDGQIKIRSDSLPVAYTSAGLELEDGSEIPADLIVFATGFERDLKLVVRQLFGDAVAEQADEYWGVDEEGEILGAFKPNSRKSSVRGVA
jgi:cation diffusion facilitator CzcD-associated flavoprotein CzcO